MDNEWTSRDMDELREMAGACENRGAWQEAKYINMAVERISDLDTEIERLIEERNVAIHARINAEGDTKCLQNLLDEARAEIVRLESELEVVRESIIDTFRENEWRREP